VLDPDGLDGAGNAAPGDGMQEGILRNHALAHGLAEQHTLHDVTRGLTASTAGPAIRTTIEPPDRPPTRIPARQMTDRFETARNCLTDAIRGHE